MATLFDLLGARYVGDWGALPDAPGTDSGPIINRAIQDISTRDGGGELHFGPGVFYTKATIVLFSNVHLVGIDGRTTIKAVLNGASRNLVSGDSVSNVRLANLVLDGNRSVVTTDGRHGVYLNGCSRVTLENVAIKSCYNDGLQAVATDYLSLSRLRVYDHGDHGLHLVNCGWCQADRLDVYDNCQVSSAGDADGIRLEVLSHDNSFTNVNAYESYLTGSRQGYGVNEATGNGCERTAIFGGSLRGNRTGAYYLEDINSIALGV